jgi:hypothetical protein
MPISLTRPLLALRLGMRMPRGLRSIIPALLRRARRKLRLWTDRKLRTSIRHRIHARGDRRTLFHIPRRITSRRYTSVRRGGRLLAIALLLLNKRALDAAQILRGRLDQLPRLVGVAQRLEHGAHLRLGFDVWACAAVAVVREATETAVLDACDFELARAGWVLFEARGAHAHYVGLVGGCEGGADGHLSAAERFGCGGSFDGGL